MVARSVFGRNLHVIGYLGAPPRGLGLAMVAIVTLLPGSTAAQSLAQRVQVLEQKVAALEAKNQPATLSVDCNAGQKINDAIAQAFAYAERVTITITGVCVESVLLNRSITALVGVGPGGATIQAPPGSTALNILSALRVTISGITITGSSATSGASVGRSSDVILFNVRITDNGFHGLLVGGAARAQLENSFVERNGGSGVFAWEGAHVKVLNTLIADSGEGGLVLQSGATASLTNGTRLTRNNDGIRLFYGCSLRFDGTTIEANTGMGLQIAGGSVAAGSNGNFIQDNTDSGVYIGDSSAFATGSGTVIQRNASWGVRCNPSPQVPQLGVGGGAGPLNAPNNGLGPTNCPFTP